MPRYPIDRIRLEGLCMRVNARGHRDCLTIVDSNLCPGFIRNTQQYDPRRSCYVCRIVTRRLGSLVYFLDQHLENAMKNIGNCSRLVLMITWGLVVLDFSSPATAKSSVACNSPTTAAPTEPATVSTASTRYGRVLVIGSADYAGCSLYVLTSDKMQSLTTAAEPFACSDNSNVLGNACDTGLWPALLTDGSPVAGPGVNRALLGTVTRTDLLPGESVQQVTYAGLPLYRFFLDEAPGETEGANLFDPVTSPAGIWYLVEPSAGRPATGEARLQLESAPIGGTGQMRTVLAVSMNNDFSVFPDVSFPVYALSPSGGRRPLFGHEGECRGICAAVPWPPVLTADLPQAGPGVDQGALGVIVRPDGSHQVTYHGKPLYLFYQDAYILGVTRSEGIYGAGKATPWGVFNTIPPSR
jgi:predicted lipoprotein with Yx(FWY)xxD motif